VRFAHCDRRSVRDETSRQSIAAVIRASGGAAARGAMIESNLAAREAAHRNRTDLLNRVWRGRSGQRDRPGHDNVAREARYDYRRGRLERLVATKLADFKLLSHAQLDLALRAHTKLLEELPHRHVEGVFVHSSLLDPLI
jgi:hypothetical protein